MARENFSTRLGFLLISAGCAIGLGNVWRFPYVTGLYGGGAFVLLYVICLLFFGVPILVMEFSVGRASKKSAVLSFRILEPKGTKWHLFGYVAAAGNYLLMLFYTTIGGWMLCYLVKMIDGEFVGLSPDAVGGVFDSMLQSPTTLVFWMAVAVLLGFFVCSLGLQKGVERVTKWMMSSLFVVMLVLVVRSLTLPGAGEGLRFYLYPDFEKLVENGFGEVLFAAMGQAFFTLSTGIGSMAIFGSYIGNKHTLTGEAITVAGLDTIVAFLAGLIIFPACFAFGVNPGQGPGLVFVTLPNIFNAMPGGRFFGILFFIFMVFAALSTIIAVFENIIAFGMDLFNWSRRKAVVINLFVIFILSLPAALGFNLLSGIQPMGSGTTILDLEDFIVSNNLLPLGSLVYLLFCTTRYGWGFQRFVGEADIGAGIKFPKKLRFYLAYVLPAVILFIFVTGYVSKFKG